MNEPVFSRFINGRNGRRHEIARLAPAAARWRGSEQAPPASARASAGDGTASLVAGRAGQAMTEDYEAALTTAMARRLIAGANEDEVMDVTKRLMETVCAVENDVALIALATAVSMFAERTASNRMTPERIVAVLMDLVKRLA
jgi:hypothetical protein